MKDLQAIEGSRSGEVINCVKAFTFPQGTNDENPEFRKIMGWHRDFDLRGRDLNSSVRSSEYLNVGDELFEDNFVALARSENEEAPSEELGVHQLACGLLQIVRLVVAVEVHIILDVVVDDLWRRK